MKNCPCTETSLRFPRSGLCVDYLTICKWSSLWPCWQKPAKSSLMWDTNTLCLHVWVCVPKTDGFLWPLVYGRKSKALANETMEQFIYKSYQTIISALSHYRNTQVWLSFKKLLKSNARFKSKLDFLFFWRKRERMFFVHTVNVNGVQSGMDANVLHIIFSCVPQIKNLMVQNDTKGVNDCRMLIFVWTILLSHYLLFAG